MYKWYVIQAKPGQLDRAAEALDNQGYEIYLPKIATEVVRRGKRITEDKPLFPGYLFIYLSEVESNWRPIRSTRGVAKLVSFGTQPAVVPHQVVAAIRQQLTASTPDATWEKDQTVQITRGPFKDLSAVFDAYDGDQRAYILLELLGRWQRLSIDLSDLSS